MAVLLQKNLKPKTVAEYHSICFLLIDLNTMYYNVVPRTYEFGEVIEVKLTFSQLNDLSRLFGDNRYVWNKVLERLQNRYKSLREYAKNKDIKLYDKNHKVIKKNWNKVPKKYKFPKSFKIISSWLTAMKKKHTWLKEADSKALQNQVKNLYDTYWKAFRHKCGTPNFKSGKNHYQSWLTNSASVLGKKFFHGKKHGYILSVGLVRLMSSQNYFKNYVKQIIFEQRPNGKYYVALTIECDNQALSVNDRSVGIDLGREYAMILSNGQKINRKKNDPKLEKKSQYWQSKAAHKRSIDLKTIKKNNKKYPNIKPSYKCRKSLKQFKRYQECRRNHARCEATLKQRKYDWYQKETTKIAKDYSFIAMEDLNIIKMIESKKTIKNAHIMDADWGIITKMLEYKAKEFNDTLVLVNPMYTSKICYADFT